MNSVRKSGSTVAEVRKYSKSEVQDALQTTFILKGTLKRAQLMYLRIGELLVKVRDQKLYEALKHPDMIAYAHERLGLGKSSLYSYLRVYDWALVSHPEWLEPKVQGFVPDLSDVSDLMWIESELAKTKIPTDRRLALEKLREQGLAGKLRRSDVRSLRKQDNTPETGTKKFLSQLRGLRKRGKALAGLPPEVVTHLDAAIDILTNDRSLKQAGLTLPTQKWHRSSVA